MTAPMARTRHQIDDLTDLTSNDAEAVPTLVRLEAATVPGSSFEGDIYRNVCEGGDENDVCRSESSRFRLQ